MYRDELLEQMKDRVSERDYFVLSAWTKVRERKLLGLRKTIFRIDKPSVMDHGYIIRDGCDYIIVG